MKSQSISIKLQDYDLAATLDSGQVFRWNRLKDFWVGIVDGHVFHLRQVDSSEGHEARSKLMVHWDGQDAALKRLKWFLQLGVDLREIVSTFPDDTALKTAVAALRGLRLLRQDPWECLASFILSSTKQIVQIRQIVALICERFGARVEHVEPGGSSATPYFTFPTPQRLAECTERDLRACKMGFRARYLLETSRMVARGELDLDSVWGMSCDQAREYLKTAPGVGDKIADCVLLFAYGFPSAFPIDVWVARALQNLYFSGKKCSMKELKHFASRHFGEHAGYAQQYLFHYIRTHPLQGQ